MDWYKRYVGDYMRDTRKLSMLEHGAYVCLLDNYYAKNGEIPSTVKELNRICGAETPTDKRAVGKVLRLFFPLREGKRRNGRADAEILKARVAADHSREAGKLGGRPPKSRNIKDSQNLTGSADKPDGLEVENLMGSVKKPIPDSRYQMDNSVPSGEVKPGPRSAASILAGRNGTHKAREEDPEEERLKRAIVLLNADPNTTEADAARMFRVSIDAIREARGPHDG